MDIKRKVFARFSGMLIVGLSTYMVATKHIGYILFLVLWVIGWFIYDLQFD